MAPTRNGSDNSTIETVTLSVLEDSNDNLLNISLAVVGSFLAIVVVTITIQHYVKKGLKRDLVNLMERKKKLDKGDSPGQTLPAHDDDLVQEEIQERENEKEAEDEVQPKSILKAKTGEMEMPKMARSNWDTKALERLLKEMTNLMFGNCAPTSNIPVPSVVPGEPMTKEKFSLYIGQYIQKTREMSKLQLAVSLADMLLASLGISLSHWDCPSVLAELDAVAAHWFGRTLNLPPEFLFKGKLETSPGGGCVVDGEEESLFLAVIGARTSKLNTILGTKEDHYLDRKKNMDRIHYESSRMLIYANRKAFPSLSSICQTATVGARLVEDLKSLEAMILDDFSRGYLPALVVVSLGEDGSDDVQRVSEVAKKHGLLVHLDCGPVIPLASPLSVDTLSVTINSINSTVIYTKDQRHFCRPFSWKDPAKRSIYSVADWGIHERRQAKGFRLWFAFSLLGIEEFRKEMQRGK